MAVGKVASTSGDGHQEPLSREDLIALGWPSPISGQSPATEEDHTDVEYDPFDNDVKDVKDADKDVKDASNMESLGRGAGSARTRRDRKKRSIAAGRTEPGVLNNAARRRKEQRRQKMKNQDHLTSKSAASSAPRA